MPSIEIRPIAAAEMEQFRRVVRYAFADNRDVLPPIAPEWSVCAIVDGRVGATSAAWPLTVRINGAAVAVAGVTMVATLPELRRLGLLRRIMGRALALQRERGQSVAMLWASFGAIYQRFGYGPASNEAFYTFDPRRVPLHPGGRVAGRVELLERDRAFAQIKPVYVEHATPRNLLLHRGQAMWEFNVLREQDGARVHVAAYRAESGALRGYVAYETQGPAQLQRPETLSPNQELRVRDLVALDVEAYRALWSYLLAHDLVRTIQMGPLAEDDPAPLLVTEPRQLQRRLSDGIWMRIVDVERALAQRPYACAGELAIEVRGDDLCDWNQGTWMLRTDGPKAQVARGRRGPDLVLPPRSLAALFSGHSSATQLFRAGLLDARDSDTLARADALFATAYRPHCADLF
jgi:predicted acetyltransferase